MVVAVVRPFQSRAPQNSHSLSAWGEPLLADQETADRYGFTQRENDPESGLMHYRARGYDPKSARLQQRDPEERVQAQYIYASNNPVRFMDPIGRQALEVKPDPKPVTDQSLTYGGYRFRFSLKKSEADEFNILQHQASQLFMIQKNADTHEIEQSVIRSTVRAQAWQTSDTDTNDYLMASFSWPAGQGFLTHVGLARIDAYAVFVTGTYILAKTDIEDAVIKERGLKSRIPKVGDAPEKAPEDAATVLTFFTKESASTPKGPQPEITTGSLARIVATSVQRHTTYRYALFYVWDRASKKELLAFFALRAGEKFGPSLLKGNQIGGRPDRTEFIRKPDLVVTADLK